MAQRRAEVFHNEFFSCFEISATAVAFCNCKSYFHNCFPISILTLWRSESTHIIARSYSIFSIDSPKFAALSIKTRLFAPKTNNGIQPKLNAVCLLVFNPCRIDAVIRNFFDGLLYYRRPSNAAEERKLIALYLLTPYTALYRPDRGRFRVWRSPRWERRYCSLQRRPRRAFWHTLCQRRW